ncbi:hypothetical protein HYU23_03165 [Candidatus Woesearchaeota archaeon]|nr:hypothetical protein [Candidatus Woesearchaeota archaeon]
MEPNVIKQNLELMESSKRDGMEGLLIENQSLRPNNSIPGSSFANVAFYFNDKTGQIEGFIRVDSIYDNEVRHYGIWKVTIMFDLEEDKVREIFYRISDVKYPKGVSKSTEKTINDSIKIYNKRHHGSFDN